MFKFFYFFLFFCLFQVAIPAIAQRYGTAMGIRFGNSELSRTVGLSVQQRVLERVTLEAILQSDFSRNTNFSLLAERHRPIISKRFNYYYGGGIGFGKEESFIKNEETMQIDHTYGNSTVGVDLIAGVELTVANAVISLDYKPNINLAGRSEFYRGQVGISARTVLVKSKEQKKKQRQRQKAKRSGKKQTVKPFSDLFKKK
ncbi:hypothetical protein [Algoriphagus boritolerans]|nr:hypothetical protein [Algoriphagus boritolerans]